MDEVLRLISDNDQDRAECERWWRNTNSAAKILVWNAIQKDYMPDVIAEVISRFAQIVFAEMAVKMQREAAGEKT